jgi:hypothetical protein
MAKNCWNLRWTESLFSLRQLVTSGRWGRGKLPAFSIKFRTRAIRKFLCVLPAPHDVRRKNMLTIVMINMWKRGFFPASMSTVGLNNCWSSCHLCQCTTYAGYSPVEFVALKHFHFCHKSCLLSLVDCAYLSCPSAQTIAVKSSHVLDWLSPRFSGLFGHVMWHFFSLSLYCSTTVDFLFSQIVRLVRRGKEVVRVQQMPMSFYLFLKSALL